MSRSQRDKSSLAAAGGIFSGLCPDEWFQSAWEVPYEELYRQGFRLILFDIDNTLVHHGAPADDRAVQLVRRLRGMGFAVCVLSNNGEARVKPFAEAVDALCVFKAGKPSVRGYQRACRMAGYDTSQAVCVGDQLFTDIWGARRAGIHCILVNPISPREEIQIILKRRLEWVVLFVFRAGLRRGGRTDIPPVGFQEEGRAVPTGSITRGPDRGGNPGEDRRAQ